MFNLMWHQKIMRKIIFNFILYTSISFYVKIECGGNKWVDVNIKLSLQNLFLYNKVTYFYLINLSKI
jgi:hypothetical protein